MKRILIIGLYFLVSNKLFAQSVKVFDQRTPARDMISSYSRPAFEEMPLYRVQLKITTGSSHDAGSDDPVYVQVNEGNEKFYLVRGMNNFVEGSTVEYDVLIDDIKKVEHIKFLRFGIQGGDGVCFKKVELLFNFEVVFSKEYSGETGFCMDNGSSALPSSLQIAGSELRNSPNWNFLGTRAQLWRPFKVISNAWIKNIVEAIIGNQLYQDGVKMNGSIEWGDGKTLNGAAVELWKKGAHILHFDLDLKAVINNDFDPGLDVDFDLEFSCEDGKIIIKPGNIAIASDNFSSLTTLLDGFIDRGLNVFGAVSGIEVVYGPDCPVIKQMSRAKSKFTEALDFSTRLDSNFPRQFQSCQKAEVDNSGNIILRQ